MHTPTWTSDETITTLTSSLTSLRTAVQTYWSDHNEWPGQSSDWSFSDQMTGQTSSTGQVGSGTEFSYGPYVPYNEIPFNPLTNSNDIRSVSSWPSGPEGNEGWMYNTSTGEIRCNVSGSTSEGKSWWEF